ncbi:MAG: universal stress protein [Deltaproteobacteria bacterium]|jgi:nucleotide-binding universal stress UspA family protein|nr:universal stress protein [Deltaproteobacteria bacterium]
MAIQKILVAYNFTNLDQKALDFVSSAFVHIEGVEITIFHAFTPVPEIETQASVVTGKLKGSLSYLSQQIMQRENDLKRVTEKLAENGFDESRINTVFKPRKKDIASEIISLTRDTKFDAIVLNRKAARVTRFFSGSVSNKVVMTVKDTAVCIVS